MLYVPLLDLPTRLDLHTSGDDDLIDLYEVLSIEKSASKDEIRKAYRKAALQYHPDKVPEDQRQEAEIKFKSVSRAYEILYDEQKRHIYDTQGMSAFDGSGNAGMPGGVDMDDVLASMFGMHMGGMGGHDFGGRPQKRRGHDEVEHYPVTLEDLYKGKTVKFASTKNILCSQCKGRGGKEKAEPKRCSTCSGRGFKETMVRIGPGIVAPSTEQCKVCLGAGKFFQAKDKCKKCKGERVTVHRKMLEIYIPPGSKKGDKIVLEGEGDEEPDVIPGDIVFVLHENDHPVFTRHGADLTAKITISLVEALSGFSRVVVKHLDGRGIEIRHPQKEGDVLRPNQILKIAGEGMPIKRHDTRGDLYLTIEVEFPKNGWASDPAVLNQLRGLLPEANQPKIEADTVDEVKYDSNANPQDIGSTDDQGNSAWVDDDEGEEVGAQCATQ
ncbi:hypothetical protein FQN57_006231 [Myotisia sp. PD_48]|nr:hypothetical protein FQN57_006231 [Myotisia sp. PD_48]